ncbi:MAG: YeeE/YedE family protein, partial [Ignavibacteriae bacterium]|nr:YeeE/YedE family protein [Ignavibacteriota bacterium]
MEGHKTQKHYTNPYLIGLLLGLVLLSAFVIMGRGLGASGVLSTTVAVAVDKVAPAHAQSNEFYKGYLGDGTKNPFKDWLTFSILGAVIGGFISGAISGRNKIMVEKGPRFTNGKRFLFAFIGGSLMGYGAKMARGCTSGQA